MRTTVTLDDDIYEAAEHLSLASGRRLGKVLSGLARRGLAAHEAPRRRKSQRFPSFLVPDGTPLILATRVQRILDVEGFF